jgi:hypothetical protein
MQHQTSKNNNNVPLLYRTLSTRHCSYPKYIMLINSMTPIPIKGQNLGDDVCSSLIASGRAAPLPPLVDDITDTLYWLQEIESPMHLQCIYNVVARNLLRVCIMDEEHIHPLDAHRQLTLRATHVLVHNHINPAHYGNILPIVSSFLEFCWGQQIHLFNFKSIITEMYAFLSEL